MTGVALVGLAASTASALAGSFALREQSATSQGASFAGMGTTDDDSISAMFWNPAAVTNAKGIVAEGHSTFILPRSELDVDYSRSTLPFGNGGDVGIDAFVPSSYVAYQVNDSLYLGVSVNAPYGLATHSERPWVGQYDHLKAKVFSTTVTPTIGYKVNDWLSVGLGAQIQYFKVRIQSLVPTTPNITQTLEGDDIGFGLTAGLTLTPMDGTQIGIGFRSAVAQGLDGTQQFGPLPATDINADVTLPESVNISLRQRIDDQFTLLGSVEWTNWSRLGSIPIEGGTGSLDFNYDDGWFFALGGEYKWDDNLTLRAGAAYELSPVNDENRSMRLPDADRFWLSAGATYKVNENLSLDAAYTHIFVSDAAIDRTNVFPGPVGIRYAGTAESSLDIFSVALRYRLGG